MIFAACSTTQSTQLTETVIVTLPESLMLEFCDWKGAGETVGSLAEGYVHNTLCGKKYETQLKEQREWVKKMKEEGV